MARKYTKVAQGETYGEIAASYGVEKKQVRKLMERQRRKERKTAAGSFPRVKRRPRKETAREEAKRSNEIVQLRMQVELLRDFLSEAGRRYHDC